MPENIFLTREGYEKLKENLKLLKVKKRREIASALEKARLLGDLSENAEYESAKQEQAITERRIKELEDKLMQARIVENENISVDKAYLGAKGRVSDINSNEEIEYMLVAEDEADFSQGKISISSPVGKALLGKGKGDIVSVKVPAGILKYKVLDIAR